MRRKSSPKKSVETSVHRGPLNPKESRDRINEMIKYIELVIDKRLAQLETEEESAIEKCRAEVIEAPMKEIEESFRKKKKLTEKESKSHFVNAISKAKIETLKNIENIINEIKNEVKHRIFCRLEVDFGGLMKPLLFQGLLLMLEKDVTLRVRWTDIPKVKRFFDPAVLFYYKKTNDELKIKIDELHLPETENGRMVLYNKRKTVMVVMDLQEKVDRIGSRVLPILLKTVLAGNMKMPHAKRRDIESDTKIGSVKLAIPSKLKSSTSVKNAETSDEQGISQKQVLPGLGISNSMTFTNSTFPENQESPKKTCCKHKCKKNDGNKSACKKQVRTSSKIAVQNANGESGDEDVSRKYGHCKKEPSNLAIVDDKPKDVALDPNFGRIDFPNSPSPPKKKSFIKEMDDLDSIVSGHFSQNSQNADGDSVKNTAHKNVPK